MRARSLAILSLSCVLLCSACEPPLTPPQREAVSIAADNWRKRGLLCEQDCRFEVEDDEGNWIVSMVVGKSVSKWTYVAVIDKATHEIEENYSYGF